MFEEGGLHVLKNQRRIIEACNHFDFVNYTIPNVLAPFEITDEVRERRESVNVGSL